MMSDTHVTTRTLFWRASQGRRTLLVQLVWWVELAVGPCAGPRSLPSVLREGCV